MEKKYEKPYGKEIMRNRTGKKQKFGRDGIYGTASDWKPVYR